MYDNTLWYILKHQKTRKQQQKTQLHSVLNKCCQPIMCLQFFHAWNNTPLDCLIKLQENLWFDEEILE